MDTVYVAESDKKAPEGGKNSISYKGQSIKERVTARNYSRHQPDHAAVRIGHGLMGPD
jgi:hypothetical protein